MHLHAMAGLSPAWVFVGSGRATGMRRCPATPLTRSPRRALVRPENYSQRSTTFSRARSYQCPGSLAGALGRLTRRFVPRMSITGVPRLADHLLRQQLLDNSYKAITTTPLPADRPDQRATARPSGSRGFAPARFARSPSASGTLAQQRCPASPGGRAVSESF